MTCNTKQCAADFCEGEPVTVCEGKPTPIVLAKKIFSGLKALPKTAIDLEEEDNLESTKNSIDLEEEENTENA